MGKRLFQKLFSSKIKCDKMKTKKKKIYKNMQTPHPTSLKKNPNNNFHFLMHFSYLVQYTHSHFIDAYTLQREQVWF